MSLKTVRPPASLSSESILLKSFDKSSKSRQLVWVPHATDAFRLAEIHDILTDFVLVELVGGNKGKHKFPYSEVYAAEPSSKTTPQLLPDDHCALMYLNPATLLENTRLRYGRDSIYSYVANILIAVNPYKTIDTLYTRDCMRSYQNQSIQTRPPHVFAIGDKAYREMRQMKINQSIIVSGESGSGKTESVKYILKYLTECYGQRAGLIEERILDSNPLLEAFGNAKTIKNNNSSRFGKFLELHFLKRREAGTKHVRFDISGGYISHYLLERSRICTQPPSERNYHIFYQLCAKADAVLYEHLALDTPDRFAILSRGRCTSYFVSAQSAIDSIDKGRLSSQHQKEGALYDIQLDDADGFVQCVNAMKHIGLSAERIKEVLTLVACIMHLGNIDFIEDVEDKATSGGCMFDAVLESKTKALFNASRLLGIEKSELERGLTHRTMVTRHTKRDSFILVPLNVSYARHARDGLCKALYVRLFDYMVSAVNKSIPVGEVNMQQPYSSTTTMITEGADVNNLYIGILDIAGFEYMPVNSFEQFCINYCNEKLQQFFNSRILKDEQALYEHEGLGVARIEYVDNQDCIDLIEGKAIGILSLLDEESRLPSPKFEHFTSEVFSKNKKHNRLDLARRSPLKLYRELRDDEGFMIRHFAGAVVYSTKEFIDKNNDAIHFSLLETLSSSSSSKTAHLTCTPLLSELFLMGAAKGEDEQIGKLSFLSVGSKFKTQLNDLLERLATTGTSFVRCIKPNELMKPAIFDGSHILSQLQYAGMLSVLELMQQGYPSRAKFNDLYAKYRSVLPADLARLEPRFFCKALFYSLNMSDSDFKFGLTRVFFRSGKFAEFDEIMTGDDDDPESKERMRKLVEKARSWIGRARWRKAQYTVLSAIIFTKRIEYRKLMLSRLQSAIRRYADFRQHGFIVAAVCRVKLSLTKVQECFKEVVEKSEGNDSSVNQIKLKCEQVLKSGKVILMEKLGGGVYVAGRELKYERSSLNMDMVKLEADVERLIADAYKWAEGFKRLKQEQKLKQLQLELEAESKRRENELKDKLKQEEEMKQKIAIEERRQREAEKVAKARAAAKAQKVDSGIQVKFQEQQSKLDHNLATKLAAVTGSDLDPFTIVGVSNSLAQNSAKSSKYNLSGWRYAQLRDAINTSCDIELLEACREEFHRRLKAYHIWRAKNRARGAPVERRIPPEMVEAIEGMRAVIGGEVAIDGEQRFFKVGPRSKSSASGTWYAHFDGKWICRQLHVGGVQTARPLLSGVDDVQMCELSLDETDLTTSPGLEITEAEFEKIWIGHGGQEYLKEHYAQISSKWLQDRFKNLVTLVEF